MIKENRVLKSKIFMSAVDFLRALAQLEEKNAIGSCGTDPKALQKLDLKLANLSKKITETVQQIRDVHTLKSIPLVNQQLDHKFKNK
jgi:hypothetical protein